MNDSPSLQRQLHALTAERSIRTVMARYMQLCDQPCGDHAYPQLGDLFTDDAVWEGRGALYAQTFGEQRGRDQIVAFLGTYLAPSTHFKMNVHFLTSDAVRVEGDTARGHWVMLQASTYADDRTELVSARLEVDFFQDADGWRIDHFRTQRLFDLPWQKAAA